MKILKFIMIFISIVVTMQGCDLKPEEVTKSSLRLYESSDSVKELYLTYKDDFLRISRLLENSEKFFWENDDCLFPNTKYDYSEYFTEEEWNELTSFVQLTGLYNISCERIWVYMGTNDERYGIRITYWFHTINPSTQCAIVSLSDETDKDIEVEFMEKWNRLFSRRYTVDIETIDDGWYFIINNSKE